jgi:hypothetical protein
MGSHDLDSDLWKQANESSFQPEHMPWFFYPDSPKKFCALNYGGIQAFPAVSDRVFTELAIFDTMGAFWEGFPQTKNDSTKALTSYHRRLRQNVMTELINQRELTGTIDETPSILRPWLKRTLLLLGHNFTSRAVVAAFDYPTHLLDEGVFQV